MKMRQQRARTYAVLFVLTLATNNVIATASVTSGNGLCSVYDPFKVQPDNNKYQIGGAFPLHATDCLHLQPDTVQDIVAIQWALTHWNQNPANADVKLGLFAGDTCSRPKEAVAQSLRFLDSVGYHEPAECFDEEFHRSEPKLLAVIAPKDGPSAKALGNLLKITSLPVAAYSSQAADAFVEMNLRHVLTTAPTLRVYIEAFIKLLSNLRSNLVIIVDNKMRSKTTARVVTLLRSANIYVSEIVSFDEFSFTRALLETDSAIVLSLLTKAELRAAFGHDELLNLTKLWIVVPIDGEGLSGDEELQILGKGAQLQIIALQHHSRLLSQFADYFLRVLRNNYQSYSLLTTYVEQVFNCSTTASNKTNDCALIDKSKMLSLYRQANTVESSIRMTYALAVIGAKLERNETIRDSCLRSDPECTDVLIHTLENMDYEFGENDPEELMGTRLQFHQTSDGDYMSNGIVIEGIEFVDDELKGPMVYKVFEYETGRTPRLVTNNFWHSSSLIHSVCAPYRPFCGRCPSTVQVDNKRYQLSYPKEYPFYIVGLFDFHDGEKCQSNRYTDISLPMAFVHAIWTFHQRFSQHNLLHNLELGAILVDSCSVARKAVEVVVLSENQCFSIEQADRNITIVPGSVLAYVSALNGESQDAVKRIFSSGDVPLISVDNDHNPSFDTISLMPNSRYAALGLVQLLKTFKWDYVSIVVSEKDSTSTSLFEEFDKIARSRAICIGEIIRMNGERMPDSGPPSTNVTLLFTTSKDAAVYFSTKLRRGASNSQVDVVIGEAHDFYLYDPSNVAKFVGTISFQPKNVLYNDFRHWLETTTPLTLPEQWYWKHVEDRWQCALSLANRHLYANKMCTGEELLDVPSLGRMTKSGYLSRGIEQVLLAIGITYRKLCPEQNGICTEFYTHGRKQILDILKKIKVEGDFQIYEFMSDEQGSFAFREFANWTVKDGLRISQSYRYFDANGEQLSSEDILTQGITSRCMLPLCRCYPTNDVLLNQPLLYDSNTDDSLVKGSYVRREPTGVVAHKIEYSFMFDRISGSRWRLHVHNYVFVLLISLLILTVLAVLFLVCVKLYLRVVKGNQSLGICLLLGIILMYITAYFFIFDPTDIVCRLRVTFHSFGYTVCYGVMIAKATQLRNAETLGFSNAVHISYWNYWLLLFFIIGVQLALSVRWMTEQFMSSIILEQGETQTVCSWSSFEFLLSQTYVIILLVLALFINCRNRNIKRNYKETKWLFLSSLTCTMLWICWMIAYLLVPSAFREMVVVLELMACASVLLAFLFGPKIYILLSYEPVVVEVENDANMTKNELFENTLYAKNDNLFRAVSPTESYASARSPWRSIEKSNNYPLSDANGSVIRTDEQAPVFCTVMRKKNRIQRTKSDRDGSSIAEVDEHSPSAYANNDQTFNAECDSSNFSTDLTLRSPISVVEHRISPSNASRNDTSQMF